MQNMRSLTKQTIRTRVQTVLALMCVLWLALGGVMPAQAATPRGGALSRANQPVRLLIPALEIDAPIEAVGQDDNHWMKAPSGDDQVAWYNLGPKPGETGNAVIAGHLDDVRGRPAVFWRLDELKAGDEIIVRFGNGQELRFAVMTVEDYASSEAPMERIFGVDFERDLNLITCDGEWNAASKLYERRLVVYARRIQEAENAVPENPTVDGQDDAAAITALQSIGEVGSNDVRANGDELNHADDPAQTGSPSTLPLAPSSRASHTRQNREQPLTTH